MKLSHEFTPMMMERLTAKIERAIRAQAPDVQAVYTAEVAAAAGEAGSAVVFSESTDGSTVLVLIKVGRRRIPLCDMTYAELKGEGLN